MAVAPVQHRYRLLPPAGGPLAAPALDDAQRRVVSHAAGPLLVLAGPGTGKTTTLVEAVVARIAAGAEPASIVVLTFSRKAAADLRRRIGARLGAASASPAALTFHAFCYGLVRGFLADAEEGDDEAGLRLLSAPEQDFRLREAVAGGGAGAWPEPVRPALGTAGFARELRTLLARARQLGMEPDDLAAVGSAAGRPSWQAAGEFFDDYLDALDAEGVIDYGELVYRSRLLLADPVTGAAIRDRIGAVFVDEYQDTDPAQVGLLGQLVGRGGAIVAVGDPDQSIYRFRGAEPRAVAEFAERFALPGRAADVPVVALATTRRFGPTIAVAAGAIVDRLPVVAGIEAETLRRFRHPVPADAPGSVEALTFDSDGAQAEHIADLLRRAHLCDAVAWSDMAVLVRSGRRSIPGLARALVAAGVPIAVAGDEIPLAHELAVRPLLLGLRVIADGLAIDAETAQRLLLSPLAGLDGMGVRRLGRSLRAAERAELAGAGLPRPSAELVARALAAPEFLDDCPPSREVEAARALAGALRAAADLAESGAAPVEVLWSLWRATPWPAELRRLARQGGDVGRAADRDLDAVCALFDLAARKETTRNRGLRDLIAEIDNQQIPADPNREQDVRVVDAVRVMTAHRSKGLQWPLVVVAGVQEGTWPDLGRRDSLLEPDRLAADGELPVEPHTAALAEERRLFYVACTRARRRLIVTAVAGTEGEADQPSRFLGELGVPVVAVAGRPARPLTLTGLVAQLRRTSVDPTAAPALRAAATERLAALADAVDDHGRPLVPLADPARWWGMAELSDAPAVVGDPGEPVRLSGSSLATLLACPRQWYLDRRVHAERGRAQAASLGSVIHVLAEHAQQRGWGVSEMVEHLAGVWEQLPFEARWLSASQRADAEAALERFAVWQHGTGREVLGVEVGFDVVIDLGADAVRLTGKVDRLERDAAGRIVVVDLKSGRRVPTAREAESMEQLGVYQVAVRAGAFDELTAGARELGGAEAVYLARQDGQSGPYPTVRHQASLDEVTHLDPDESGETWVHDRLLTAARTVRAGRFPAVAGPACEYCAFAASCPAVARGRQVIA